MMCARLLETGERGENTGRFLSRERSDFSSGMLDAYERGLHWVMRHRASLSSSPSLTLVATICFTSSSQRVAPAAGHRADPRRDRCRAIHFLQGDGGAQRNRGHRAAGSGCGERRLLRRRGHGKSHDEHRHGSISVLKPRDQRKASAEEIIERLREATRNVEGISLFMQAVQDVQIDSRVSRTQYQYTLQDADEAELAEWAPKLLQSCASRNWRTWPATSSGRPASECGYRPREGVALNISPQAIDDTLYDAFGQRQVSTIFTQLNQYRVILEVEPQFQQIARRARQNLRQIIDRPDGAAERVRHRESGTAPLSILHQGQFPAVTSPSILPRQFLGDAVRQSKGGTEIGLPGTVATTFPGARRNFAPRSERTIPDSRGHRRHLHRSRRALRKLHSPDHDSFDPASRRGRVAGA